MTPKMQVVWSVLEMAKSAEDAHVIAACRRLIVANRLGQLRNHVADWHMVRDIADAMAA